MVWIAGSYNRMVTHFIEGNFNVHQLKMLTKSYHVFSHSDGLIKYDFCI
jgi:hypothetical protein